jgi:glycerophosphoryl diester phosphodiesterase
MRMRPQLRLFGHRGSSGREPENTIPAFHRALADGANALELDIHQSADGEFVVIHDADGQRTAGETARIRDLTLPQLKRWNVGRSHSSLVQSYQLPTLGEVLQEFPGVRMSVDFKPRNLRAIPALLELIGRHNAETHVILASFHERVIRAIRNAGYRGRTALSRCEIACLRFLPFPLARRLVRGDAVQAPPSAGPFRLDGDGFLDRCRYLGLRADYWVINTQEEARSLLARGATGIMTDLPDQIAPLMATLADDPGGSNQPIHAPIPS